MDNYNKGWAKNIRGGLKVGLPPMKRVRHDGVRCYGEHEGKRCWPYDFSVNPAIAQAVFRPAPWPEKCMCGSKAMEYCPIHRANASL